jgi:hypothetical protein
MKAPQFLQKLFLPSKPETCTQLVFFDSEDFFILTRLLTLPSTTFRQKKRLTFVRYCAERLLVRLERFTGNSGDRRTKSVRKLHFLSESTIFLNLNLTTIL